MTEPFNITYLDVDAKVTIKSLTKRLDDLFPGQVVRLRINNEFSPLFYVGAGKWKYLPNKKRVKVFSCKLFSGDEIYEQFTLEELQTFAFLGVNIENLKIASDVSITGEEIDGQFYTDGQFLLIDQALIDSEKLIQFCVQYMGAETTLDLSNANKNGIIILKITQNKLGK